MSGDGDVNVRLGTKIRVALVAWILAEALAFWASTRLIGVGGSLALGFAMTALGFILLARAKRIAIEEVRGFMAGGRAFSASNVSAPLASALLLILPGLISDAVALGLMIPAVRESVSRRVSAYAGPIRPRGPIDLDPSEWSAERGADPRLPRRDA